MSEATGAQFRNDKLQDIEKELKRWTKVRDARTLSRDADQPSLFSMGAVVRQRSATTTDDSEDGAGSRSRNKRRNVGAAGDPEQIGVDAGPAAAGTDETVEDSGATAQLNLNLTPARQPAQRRGTVRRARPAQAQASMDRFVKRSRGPAKAAVRSRTEARAERPARTQTSMFRFVVRGASGAQQQNETGTEGQGSPVAKVGRVELDDSDDELPVWLLAERQARAAMLAAADDGAEHGAGEMKADTGPQGSNEGEGGAVAGATAGSVLGRRGRADSGDSDDREDDPG